MWDAPEKHEWNGNLLGYYIGYQMTNPTTEIGPTQGFHFKTVEVRSHFDGETLLENLNKFTQYSIVVQAYTSQGSGPPSKEIHLNTLEDGMISEVSEEFHLKIENSFRFSFVVVFFSILNQQYRQVLQKVLSAMC